jgi:hypothetical protein
MSTEPQDRYHVGETLNRIANLLTGLSLAVLFFSASAYAQNDGQKLIANVPFEFTVGRVALPRGH